MNNPESTTITTPILHWSQVNCSGNRFGFLPESGMFHSDGLHKLRHIKLKGDKHYTTLYVIYDEAYVIAWLRHNVISNFSGMPWNKLQKLLSTAYKQHQEEQ